MLDVYARRALQLTNVKWDDGVGEAAVGARFGRCWVLVLAGVVRSTCQRATHCDNVGVLLIFSSSHATYEWVALGLGMGDTSA